LTIGTAAECSSWKRFKKKWMAVSGHECHT